MMKVKDMMRRDFLRFNSNDKLYQVLSEMAKARVSEAPVLDEGELEGIISAKSIAKKLSGSEFSALWKGDPSSKLEKLGKLTAGKLCRKPHATLRADAELSSSLGALSGDEECIPVFEGRRIAGVVRCEDLAGFMLTGFAKREHAEGEARQGKAKGEEAMMDTAIDEVLSIVRRDREAPASKIASELGISQKSVEKLGATLAKHHIIRMDYSFLKGATLRLMEHGKK